MEDQHRETPLHQWHRSHQAKMALFGGYDMPLWYGSAKNEHLAVLTSAGLFDTSHMAILTVQGQDAYDLLQVCFTKDLFACIGARQEPMSPGRCVYGAILNSQGFTLDDAIVFMLAPKNYMVVVNAGMGPVVTHHLKENQAGRLLTITDWTDQVGKIDIQGPLSLCILNAVLNHPEQVLARMPYFSFKGDWRNGESKEVVTFKDGSAALISRTGYTGEFGFEIFCAPHRTEQLWDLLLAAGHPLGAVPCGLAARDSLRAGAVLPLSHQDIGHWPYLNHPWLFALPYAAGRRGFTKNFIGDQALLKARNTPHTLAFVGFDVRKVESQSAVVKDRDGRTIGKVLTCATDMGIGRHNGVVYSIASPDRPAEWGPGGLCCGFVMVEQPLAEGAIIELHDQRRTVEVQIINDIRPARTARRPLQDFMRL